MGSYAQPDWLIDRAKLAGRFPPRVRAKELWRVDPEYLEQAQDDATLLAIRAQEEAGLDIITDGEMRRESYSNHFATALDGVDIDNPGTALDRSGHPNPVPRIAGPIERTAPDRGRRRHVPPGAHRPHDQDDRARAVHDVAAGAERPLPRRSSRPRWRTPPRSTPRSRTCTRPAPTSSRSTSPTCRRDPTPPAPTGSPRSSAALDGVTGTTAVHICFGYAAIIHERPEGYSFLPELAGCSADQISIETAQSGLDLGVLKDLSEKTIILGRDRPVRPRGRVRRTPSPTGYAARSPYTTPEKITIATDCGMKYLPRASAEGKMRAMAGAARMLRDEL